MAPALSWLPPEPAFDARLAALRTQDDAASAWQHAASLAAAQLDFTQTGRLDRALTRLAARFTPPPTLERTRVALLASSTVQHLLPSLRVAGLRRGLWLDIYTTAYGQYLQELLDPASALHRFAPQVCCLLFDAPHLAQQAAAGPTAALDRVTTCWQLCRDHFSASIVQQNVLPVFAPLLGSNEQRLADSAAACVDRLNAELSSLAEAHGVALFNAAQLASTFGIDALHDPALWHLAKQEVHPSAAPVYADHLARVVAALGGRSAKCLVLDLDNTLWGGVVGDDGPDNIEVGQGSAVGEAFLAFQRYCLALRRRGIALAVCSKNDEATARSAFRTHPGMLIGEDDFACFVANWEDKAANLRHIARTLGLGLDALVFLDDNPAERALVRRELPQVHVLELPEDPSGFVRCLARSGYFEAVSLTAEDHDRAAQYRANAARSAVRETATDLHSYLSSLDMKAHWSPFTEASLPRIVQLINKTNQFNLTTPRVTPAQVRTWLGDPCLRTWQLRLTDRFGDNGIVALMAARIVALPGRPATCELSLLLMSCRVLGRRLEEEMLNLLAAAAVEAGAATIVGRFRPTPRNGIVSDLLERFGFTQPQPEPDGSVTSVLTLEDFRPRLTEVELLPPLPANVFALQEAAL